MNRIFITGTDTDVGKTWVSGLLLSALLLAVLETMSNWPRRNA